MQLRNRYIYKLWYIKQLLRDEFELRTIASLCDPRKTTLDVGGNRGAYAVTAIPFSHKVIVFEPQPHLSTLLRHILPKAIDINEVVVSGVSEEKMLAVPENERHHGWARIVTEQESTPFGKDVPFQLKTIQAVRLDDVVHENVGLIKIDVEGHEMSVLKGAEKLLLSEKPNLLIEIEERHSPGAVDTTLSWLEKRGYRSFFFDRNTLRPAADFNVDQHQNVADLRTGDRVRSSRYINNFIFIHRDKDVTIKPSLLRSLRALAYI